jgi:hypothetical protein
MMTRVGVVMPQRQTHIHFRNIDSGMGGSIDPKACRKGEIVGTPVANENEYLRTG